MIKRFFLIIIFLLFGTNIRAQLSKIHYIPPIAGTTVTDHALYVSTPSVGYINVTIKPVGKGRNDWITKTIKNDEPLEFLVGSGNSTQLVKDIFNLNGKLTNAGYIIESEDFTYVSFRINSPDFPPYGIVHSAALVSKGDSAFGSRFRTATFTNAPDGGSAQHFISVMAIDDDTKITLSDFESGIEFTNSDISGPQSSPIEKTLNKGETYIFGYQSSFVDSQNKKEALIGALVESSDALGTTTRKEVVVNVGTIEGTLNNTNLGNRDFGMDQITDVSKLGDEYIFIKGAGYNEVEKVILIADENGTEIYKDGNSTPITTLNAGEHYILDSSLGDYTNNANIYISTFNPTLPDPGPSFTKKLIAFQGIGYNDPANQGLVFVPPISCASVGDIDNIPFIEKIASNTMDGGTLTILTETGAKLQIFRNGTLIADNMRSGVYDLTKPSVEYSVIGNSNYKTYFLLSNPSSGLDLTGNISVKSDKELYLSSSTYSLAGSAGSYYSGFVTEPRITPELTVSPLGICINPSLGTSNVVLRGSTNFDTFKWKKLVGTSWIDAPTNSTTPNDQPNYKPFQEGLYKLVGGLSCFPNPYESKIQRVSICPTDFDNDGIVDNLDLDLDNDGILNKIESLGDFEIDLSNISQPVLKLPTNITVSGNYDITNAPNGTFNGFSNGEFESKITASGINETAIYTINPLGSVSQRNLNINIKEDLNSNRIDHVEYTIKVYPSDKNITLIDPGEKLLVDNGSGFVTVPKEGFSGNEILFKYKTDSSSILDIFQQFNFFAYEIEGIEFSHSISSTAIQDSYFKAEISIIDFDLDTDGNGILNIFDIDSDGDGCNDIIESDTNFKNTDPAHRPRFDRDSNSDGIFGDLIYGPASNEPIRFPDVDFRGRIKDLKINDNGTPSNPDDDTYNQPPTDPNNGKYLFLDSTAPEVKINVQPVDFQVCELGQQAIFFTNVDANFGISSNNYVPYYQWQVDKQDGNGWIDVLDSTSTPITIDATLTIDNIDVAMNGWQYRVLTYSDGALCYTISDPATLGVEATKPTAQVINGPNTIIQEDWLIKCDDGSDPYDGKSTFDLNVFNPYILGSSQSPLDFEVTYFLDGVKALLPDEIGITTPSNFINDAVSFDRDNPTEQKVTIHVRVKNKVTDCLADPSSFELTINPNPVLNTTSVPLQNCAAPGSTQGLFNLTEKEKDFSDNYENLDFFYYEDAALTIPILNTDKYTLDDPVFTKTIYVAIQTQPTIGSACPANSTVEIDLEWFRTGFPASYVLKDEYLNSTTGNLKGQNQTGIETFDKSIFTQIKNDLIIADPIYLGKSFKFYPSENDAQRNLNEINISNDFIIDPNYKGFVELTDRWTQELWVEIEGNVGQCLGLFKVATFHIIKRPIFFDVISQELCDDQPNVLDKLSLFDTSSLYDEFTKDNGNIVQDTNLFDVEYTDATGNTVIIDPSFNSTTQQITVTLTNKTTIASLPFAQSVGTIDFIVHKQPKAYPNIVGDPTLFSLEECDDDGTQDGERNFDVSNIKDELLTDLTGFDPPQNSTDFDFVFSVGGTIVDLSSGIYLAKNGDQMEVTITNPIFTGCEETITIEFIVNTLPQFDIDDDTIVCLNLDPIEIGTSNWDNGTDPTIYLYEWYRQNLDGTDDPSFSENTEIIAVSKGGIYTVKVTNPNTGCFDTDSITVTESEIASLDKNLDGNVDIEETNHFIEKTDLTDDGINTITVNNIDEMGIGDYWFSLDDPFGPYEPANEEKGPNSHVFNNNIKPGLHTVYIRDNNSYYTYEYGCGITQVEISIVGYKKYFTPNGDAFNNKWKILGINPKYNPNTKIYIFDRYGKLMKKLDPESEGWDGTYLGKPLPATDYWFRVFLNELDGTKREIKGHFSLVRGKF